MIIARSKMLVKFTSKRRKPTKNIPNFGLDQLDTERGFVRVAVTATLWKGRLIRWRLIMRIVSWNFSDKFDGYFDGNGFTGVHTNDNRYTVEWAASPFNSGEVAQVYDHAEGDYENTVIRIL